MRILVLVPRDHSMALAAPLVALGHDVAVVATDRNPQPPEVPQGAMAFTRGRWYAAFSRWRPTDVVALTDDETAADFINVPLPYQRGYVTPGAHWIPRGFLSDPPVLAEMLHAAFPSAQAVDAPVKRVRKTKGLGDQTQSPSPSDGHTEA